MKQITHITRIAVGLTCLSVSLVLVAATLGLVPSRRDSIVEGRRTLSETIAVNCSLFASHDDFRSMKTSLAEIVDRNPDVQAVRVWRADGSVLFERTGGKSRLGSRRRKRPHPMKVSVPMVDGKERWGTLELAFRPLGGQGFIAFARRPVTRLVLFLAAANFVLFFVYMRATLQYLDPSRVMPERVRHMLDTFAEGLMVIDKQQCIVHTNEAFTRLVGLPGDDLRGRRASDFPWVSNGDDPDVYPWTRAVTTPTFETGLQLGLNVDGLGGRTFRVNTSSILDDEGESCGALISLDDVTLLEASRAELRNMLDKLKRSRDEVRRQNRDLERMARVDPLTSCLNRRAFYSDFESFWLTARRYNKPLSCIILDVDHFKSVNDRFGHSTGDQVLQQVGKTLRETMRDSDLVCRYGGEEFCALLPETDMEAACRAAERSRKAIEGIRCGEVSVTVSLGVSALGSGAMDPRELLDQADKALYAAKGQGRNQTVIWDESLNVQEAFGSEALPELVRCHHAWFGGIPHNGSLPQGEGIPLKARILATAEAYDAMVSASVYRSAMSPESAFAKLRSCAGEQFDPQLVERLSQHVRKRRL